MTDGPGRSCEWRRRLCRACLGLLLLAPGPVGRSPARAEEARVRVRSNRRTAIDEAKKLKGSGALTEDQLRDAEGEIQKLTDRFVKSIDDHLKHKEAEVMKV